MLLHYFLFDFFSQIFRLSVIIFLFSSLYFIFHISSDVDDDEDEKDDGDEKNQTSRDSKNKVEASDVSAGWMEVLTSVVVPGMRRGLKQSTDIVKKGFVALLAHIVEMLGNPTHRIFENINTSSMSSTLLSPSVWFQLNESYHSDLVTLLHEDPEQNFFENINHIQLHRRVRAFSKLRMILRNAAIKMNSPAFRKLSSELTVTIIPNSGGDDVIGEHSQVEELSDSANDVVNTQERALTEEHSPIGIASLTHVLLPIALHPLVSEEFQKKDHLTLLQESAAFIGSIGESIL